MNRTCELRVFATRLHFRLQQEEQVDFARGAVCALHRVVGARDVSVADSGQLVEAVMTRVDDMLCAGKMSSPPGEV